MLAVEFSRLYTAYAPHLVRQLKRQHRQFAGEAEGVVQDVFRKLWELAGADSPQAGEYPDVPEAWLSRSATNAMIDISGSMLTRPEPSGSAPGAGIADLLAEVGSTSLVADADAKENTERTVRLLRSMRNCLESMPPHERALLILKYLEGLSYPEIAERTGYSRGSVGTLLLRARRSLHDGIASFEAQESG